MLAGVISDTHDRLPTFRQAIELFKQRNVDVILHAGDFVAPFAAKLLLPESVGDRPVHLVFGNNDGERDGLAGMLPQLVDGPLKLQLDGCSLVMHHYVDWLKPEDHAQADVVISGHNHTPSIETREGKLFLNPGEACGWVHGRCTCALLDTQTRQAELVDLDPAAA